MDVARKAAYLKGLAKGLEIDSSTKEGKLLLALVDAFGALADEVTGLEEAWEELDEAIEVLDEDLESLEEDFYRLDEYEDDDEDSCDCDCCDDDEEELYEVTCPECGEKVYLDADMLQEGSMHCPNCDNLLEFIDPDELDELLDSEEEDENEAKDE